MTLYVLRDNGRIIRFGHRYYVPRTEDQTVEVLANVTLAEYAGRFRLKVDQPLIQADGEEEALVTVYSNAGVGSVDVDVNGLTVNVPLVGGQGTLPPITAETAGQIVVKPADETQFSSAGEGLIVITAVEGADA